MIELLAQCAQVAVPEASDEAVRFYNSGNLLWAVQQLWGFIIPLLFLMTGFSGKMAAVAKSWGRNWFFTIIVYLIFFVALYQLFNLPLDFYSGYIRMHEYGLSVQTIGRWLDNYGKGVLVLFVSASAFIWVFYLLLKKSPKRWWLYSSIASTLIGFFMMFIQPIWIDPLFNNFGPMKNKELEGQILSLARKAGIEQGRVYEVDKSQDTNMVNAYVTGFGKTSRIVLWDTLVQQLTPDEVIFVMGHEMGHYVLDHVWWSILYYAALSFAIFYLTHRSAHAILRRFSKRFRFSELSNIASLPLLLLLVSLFTFATDPLSNFVSRCMEHEADRFGLEITQNNQAAGETFLALQKKNLAIPRPGSLFVFWRASHPPLGERVDFTNSYCPWSDGQPLRYEKYFRVEDASSR